MSVTMKCDICGEEIPRSGIGDNLSIITKTELQEYENAPLGITTTKFDVCIDCCNGLINIIRSYEGKKELLVKLFDYM